MRSDATPPPFSLPAVLDTRTAVPLRDALLARRGEVLTLDGSEVTRLGGLCLEVLLSARRTWADDAMPFRLANPSDALAEGLAIFGATNLLGGEA
ncbi:STAS domain-containing protein [Roseomonas sp. CCTCC AB2023176]|uniref:STAS domain-containing protein n=1 Tax=Roseomonas sp. CCTCC AB2023176 TaxID=3342640 RepID=UPI0035D56798